MREEPYGAGMGISRTVDGKRVHFSAIKKGDKARMNMVVEMSARRARLLVEQDWLGLYELAWEYDGLGAVFTCQQILLEIPSEFVKTSRGAMKHLPEFTCNCQECQSMCVFPCMGTPAEIQAIISAGYAYSNKLVVCSDNHPDLDFTVVKPRRNDKHCVYFEDGKCQLHDAGLKLLEGRVAIHDQAIGKVFYRRLAKLWNTRKGRALIERIRLENQRPENPYRIKIVQQHP